MSFSVQLETTCTDMPRDDDAFPICVLWYRLPFSPMLVCYMNINYKSPAVIINSAIFARV